MYKLFFQCYFHQYCPWSQKVSSKVGYDNALKVAHQNPVIH